MLTVKDGQILFLKLNSAVSGKSAVNGQNAAGNKSRRAVVNKKAQSTEQLASVTKSDHRRTAKNLSRTGRGSAILVKEKMSVLICQKEAGSYRVDSYSFLGKMYRQPTGKIRDPRLSRAVCRGLG